jgi:4-amino-4-deoxy-L-arabinose transferase-like glycosyltransferase
MPHRLKKIFYDHWIFIGILLLAGFLRLYDLDFWSLWSDEFYTLWRADRPMGETLEKVKDSPFPPLYYLMMNIWVKIFGLSDFMARLPSVIFSVGAVIVLYIFVDKLFNREVALLSCLLVALNPFQIEMAQNAKMYPMLWFFILLSMFYFWKIIHGGENKNWILYLLTTLASVYTMYIGWINFLLHNLMYIFYGPPKKNRKWLWCQLIILLCYVPWISYFFCHAIGRKGINWITSPENHWIAFKDIFANLLGLTYFYDNKVINISALLMGLLIGGGIFHFKNKKFSKSLIYIWAGTLFTYLVFYTIEIIHTPILVFRYLGLLSFLYAILLALGIYTFPRWWRYLVLAGVLGFFLNYPTKSYLIKKGKYNNEAWRTLIGEIKEILPRKPTILNGVYLEDGALLYAIGHYGKVFDLPIAYSVSDESFVKSKDAVAIYRHTSLSNPPIRKLPTHHLGIYKRVHWNLEYTYWFKKE